MEELQVEGQLKMKDLADKLNEIVRIINQPAQGAGGVKECLERVATLTGNGNILREFGLERWVPGKSDMTKYDS